MKRIIMATCVLGALASVVDSFGAWYDTISVVYTEYRYFDENTAVVTKLYASEKPFVRVERLVCQTNKKGVVASYHISDRLVSLEHERYKLNFDSDEFSSFVYGVHWNQYGYRMGQSSYKIDVEINNGASGEKIISYGGAFDILDSRSESVRERLKLVVYLITHDPEYGVDYVCDGGVYREASYAIRRNVPTDQSEPTGQP